jgi:hypothetical protein
LAIPILEKEEQLAEHLRDVASVDFINHQHVGRIRIRRSGLSDTLERTVLERESRLTARGLGWTEPLEEIFVGISWVELHDSDLPAFLGGEQFSKLQGNVSLAGSRGPEEDQLASIFQQLVFTDPAGALAHIPPAQRGMLGPPSAERTRGIREKLAKDFNRDR